MRGQGPQPVEADGSGRHRADPGTIFSFCQFFSQIFVAASVPTFQAMRITHLQSMAWFSLPQQLLMGSDLAAGSPLAVLGSAEVGLWNRWVRAPLCPRQSCSAAADQLWQSSCGHCHGGCTDSAPQLHHVATALRHMTYLESSEFLAKS